MKSIIKIIALLLMCFPSIAYGQNPTLQNKLKGLDRVEDIMNIVDQHYAKIKSGDIEKTDEIRYKHWARWGLYMSARTAPDGKLVNVDKNIRYAQRAYNRNNKNVRSSNGNWFFRGPNSISGSYGSAVGISRVDRIAFHPTDPNVLYIGTPSGGLWKSVTGGSTWTPLTDNIPSLAISGIVVSHANPNTIYILTGDGDGTKSGGGGFPAGAGYLRSSAGVFVSYDAGVNWQSLTPLTTADTVVVDSYFGYQLVQDPNDANILLAATDIGIYRTSNAGVSWTKVLTNRTFEIKFHPGISNIIYATQIGKFFRSLDGGLNWNEITDFDLSMPGGRVALAVSNGHPNKVYLFSGLSQGSNFRGFHVSHDSGTSFTRQSNSPNIVESGCTGLGGSSQQHYDLALAVSHVGSNKVIAGGIWAWGSSDTGITWSNISPGGRCNGNTTSTGYVHADVHDIEYNPLTDEVFLCTDGGLVKSANDGQDWINLSDGIGASQIYHMAGSLLDINKMMIGLQDNGVKSRNSNTDVWDNIAGTDGFDCIYDVKNANTGYFSANEKTYRFTGNGSNLNEITPGSRFFPRLQVHNTMNGFVLAGYDSLFRSTNYGTSWKYEGISGNWDIERCPNNDNRFYSAGGASAFASTGSIWRSDDNGLNWIEISGSSGYPTAVLRITDLEVQPNNSDHIYFTLGGFGEGEKVFVSYNAGGSWINLSGSLPNIPVNAIQVDQNQNMYIATDIGVFYRGNGMSDWAPFWHNLPIIPASDLELYEGNSIIRVSTFGRGVWESPTYNSCPQQVVLFLNLSGHKYYEAWDWITCNSTIYGGQNTDVILKAGDHIILSQGFTIGPGNRFRAYISPCGVTQLKEE